MVLGVYEKIKHGPPSRIYRRTVTWSYSFIINTMDEITRTMAKRNAQVKVITGLMQKGNELISDEVMSEKKCRELAALLKNIRTRKEHLDKLNELIIDEICFPKSV